MNKNRKTARMYAGIYEEGGLVMAAKQRLSPEQRRKAARRYKAEKLASLKRRPNIITRWVKEATDAKS